MSSAGSVQFSLQPGRSYLLQGSVSDEILNQFEPYDRLIVQGAELDVKTLREIISTVQLAAASKMRLLLIEQAERLSEVMQNTLLKVLEEPPKSLVIVLNTDQEQRLLPTVISRLHRLSSNAVVDTGLEPLFNTSHEQAFAELSSLEREELVAKLSQELKRQKTLLLSADTAAPDRIELLNQAVRKLQQNTNLKLTLDWLLLHWYES